MSSDTINPTSASNGESLSNLKVMLNSAPKKDKIQILSEEIYQLSSNDRKALSQMIPPPPTAPTNDRMWLIIIITVALTLITATVTLGFAAFTNQPDNPIVSGEILLSIFSASIGFFGGLLIPSAK